MVGGVDPIRPERDPVLPVEQLRPKAVERLHRDELSEDAHQEEREEAREEQEEFEHVLDEVVDDGYPTSLQGAYGPTEISDAVTLGDASAEVLAEAEPPNIERWNLPEAPERRADGTQHSSTTDDEDPGPHIDISA